MSIGYVHVCTAVKLLTLISILCVESYIKFAYMCVLCRDKNVFMQYSKHQELKMQQVRQLKLLSIFPQDLSFTAVLESICWYSSHKSDPSFIVRRSISFWRSRICIRSVFSTVTTWCTPLCTAGHH